MTPFYCQRIPRAVEAHTLSYPISMKPMAVRAVVVYNEDFPPNMMESVLCEKMIP